MIFIKTVASSNNQKEGRHDVKSLLLPISPVEKLLEKLLEALPRKKESVRLTPIKDVAIISLEGGKFKSTGNSPSFKMELAGGVKSGWYYLEAALTRNNGSRIATLVAEVDGCDLKLTIPSVLRGTIREVMYFPKRVSQLTWIPTAAPGYFSQSELQLHRISSIESFFRRFYRVVYDLWRFRHAPPVCRSGLTWSGALMHLQDGYEKSSQLRIKRLVSNNDYLSFVAQNDGLSDHEIKRIRRQIQKQIRPPLFSIIMPLSQYDLELLRASLSSISAQIYEHWELIIAVPSTDKAQILGSIHDVSAGDTRIKIVYVEAGGKQLTETAILLNGAVKEARGEWIIRVNPHDRLSNHSLFHFFNECTNSPDALCIYGDDDEIGVDGQRKGHRFKPDWNPDLLTSCDYIGNSVTYRRTRLVNLGGYATGFEGSEGYELALRYLNNIPDKYIRHIHRVIYHRFSEPPSESSTKIAHEAGRLALERYFNNRSIIVEDGPGPTLYRIRYTIPASAPLVSIIIPTRDKVELLRACIQSIQKKTDYPAWEILIIDNGSVEPETHEYFESIKNDTRIRVVPFQAPFNYSAINNYAVGRACGEVLALINNDVEVISTNWLSEMVGHALRPEIGAVGAKLLYPDGTVQHAGVILGIGGVAAHVHRFLRGDAAGYCNRAILTQNFSAVTGACLVVKRKVYQEVGGLDENHLRVAFNDIDFCLRLVAAGYRIVFTPFALLFHHESISRGVDDTPEKKKVFENEFNYMKSKWGDRLGADFAYNTNLSLEFDDFSLKRLVG